MTIIEIVMLTMLGVALPTMLGLTIWATANKKRTVSRTISYYSERNNWLVVLVSVLTGHWFVSPWIPWALNYWPYCFALLIGVLIKDIIRAVMDWPLDQSTRPYLWLLFGLALGSFLWKG